MKNTADRTSSTSNSPKASPVTVETFEDVLRLMEVDHLDIGEETKVFAVGSTQELLERYGPEWIREHKALLTEELEYLDKF